MAAFGTALNATISGYSAVYARRELPIRKPSITPTTMAIPKPSIVTHSVFHAASSNGPLNSMNSRAICSGLGKMNSGTAEQRHDELPQQQHHRQHDQRRPTLDVLRDLHVLRTTPM